MKLDQITIRKGSPARWIPARVYWGLSDLAFRVGSLGHLADSGRNVLRIPVCIKIQFAAVVLALLSAMAVSILSGHGGYEKTAFAIPANVMARPSWEKEKDRLAGRINRAFGVGSHTAVEFAGWIMEAAERQSLSPDLIASVVFTESSFRKNVTSHVGAIGPAQVRPDFWGQFCGSNNLADPAENIYCGAQILSYFKESCGAESCALHAYNVGPSAREGSYYAEAGRRYVSKIGRHKRKLETIQL